MLSHTPVLVPYPVPRAARRREPRTGRPLPAYRQRTVTSAPGSRRSRYVKRTARVTPISPR